jgi:hypothetical protein
MIAEIHNLHLCHGQKEKESVILVLNRHPCHGQKEKESVIQLLNLHHLFIHSPKRAANNLAYNVFNFEFSDFYFFITVHHGKEK